MPKFSLRIKHWKDLILLLVPRITGTAITLSTGLIIGIIFGAMSSLGFPFFLGAVLTVGLSYHIGSQTRGNISSYVGLVGGLSVFDQIIRLQTSVEQLIPEIGIAALTTFYGTFAALLSGWGVGVVIGVITRLCLPRGYRTYKSDAYERPLSLQPFKSVTISPMIPSLLVWWLIRESEFCYRSLADIGLRTKYQVSVLSILRSPKDIVAPDGHDIIYPGDVLVALVPVEKINEITQLVRGSVPSGEV